MIETSISAAVDDEVVRLALTVTNAGDEPATHRFRSGQRVEFVVRRAGRDADCNVRDDDDEAVVWRHSEGRLFTQALGSETLDPGASTTYEATWADPDPGAYEVDGEVVADDVRPTARTTLTVQ